MKWGKRKRNSWNLLFACVWAKLSLFQALLSASHTQTQCSSLCERNRYNAGWTFLEKAVTYVELWAKLMSSASLSENSQKSIEKCRSEYKASAHRTGEAPLVCSHILLHKRTLMCALDVSTPPETIFWFRFLWTFRNFSRRDFLSVSDGLVNANKFISLPEIDYCEDGSPTLSVSNDPFRHLLIVFSWLWGKILRLSHFFFACEMLFPTMTGRNSSLRTHKADSRSWEIFIIVQLKGKSNERSLVRRLEANPRDFFAPNKQNPLLINVASLFVLNVSLPLLSCSSTSARALTTFLLSSETPAGVNWVEMEKCFVVPSNWLGEKKVGMSDVNQVGEKYSVNYPIIFIIKATTMEMCFFICPRHEPSREKLWKRIGGQKDCSPLPLIHFSARRAFHGELKVLLSWLHQQVDEWVETKLKHLTLRVWKKDYER